MLSVSLLVALFAAFLAGCVSGLTGFGLALISVPLLLFVYDPTTVVVVTAWLSVAINVAVVWDSWRDARKRLVLALLPPAFLGIVAGVGVLSAVDAVYIRLGVGIAVVISTLLLLREVKLPGAKTWLGPAFAGSVSGALSTSTGLAAPPIVILLASRGLPKHAFRGSSALYFLVMSTVGIAALALWGLMDGGHVTLALILIPAAFVGKVVGTTLLNRISEKAFRRATLVFTLLTGVLGVATALWALI